MRFEKSGAQKLELSKISRIQIASDEPGSDGFAKASIELFEPSYKGDGFVRLKLNGNPVRLTGFSSGQERVDIPIAKCRALAFRAPKPSEYPPTDGPKK